MGKHAILSPSGSHTWSLCLASPALSVGKPNRSSPFADEGTIAHKVSDLCFTTDIDALSLVGKKVKVFEDADEILITDDLARNVDVYVSQVREAAVGKVLYSEQTLPTLHKLPTGDFLPSHHRRMKPRLDSEDELLEEFNLLRDLRHTLDWVARFDVVNMFDDDAICLRAFNIEIVSYRR